MKKDYSKHPTPSGKRIAAHFAIKETLKEGKKTFTELLNETCLGRSTLAFHLKGMSAKGEVDRETDPKDYRKTIYRFKHPKWTPELQKEEDIETLSSMDVNSNITPELLTKLAQGLPKILWPALVETALPAKLLSEYLKEYMSYSVYSVRSGKKKVEKDTRQLAEKAASSIMEALFRERRYLEKLSDFGIVIRFKKVSELAKKLEEQEQQIEEEGLDIPEKPGENL